MYLGRVIGTAVTSVKTEGLEGKKFLIVQPLDHRLSPSAPCEVAVDAAQAGAGDLVFLVGGREAALALSPSFVPVDATIVGIVDRVDAKASNAKASEAT